MENKVDEVKSSLSRNPNPVYSFTLKNPYTTVSQWRQDLLKWFSSPDPSTNHIILCGTRHQGPADWFFRGSIFEEWKSTGSLLWIHGKRTSSNPSPFHLLMQLLSSGLREECPLVRRFSCVIVSYRLSYLLAPR